MSLQGSARAMILTPCPYDPTNGVAGIGEGEKLVRAMFAMASKTQNNNI